MKPVTNLLTVTHTRNEARRKLVKSRDETCHKLWSITILNHRCLWTVTNLQWNLLQNRDETCYRLVNCYKLVIKLVTNLLRVTKLWWRFRQWLQSCQWKLSQTFCFRSKGALKQGLFHRCRVWRWWSTLHVFCVVSEWCGLEPATWCTQL